MSNADLPVGALFDQRIDGDDALLRLAGLRFAQAGLATETYADSPERLEWILRFAPSHTQLPVVHLSRDINVLTARGRSVVADFAARFAGRVGGLVVHDKREMAAHTDDLVAGLRDLGPRLHAGPYLFLEYAAGLDLGWFVAVGERLRDVRRVGLCIDVGHVGIAEARRNFLRSHPGLDVAALTPDDDRLPDLIADVQGAVSTALPAVIEVTDAVRRIGKPLHYHLHDGHPLISGLSDHFSFLTQIPIPFVNDGRSSLPSMYGPHGLAAIVNAALEARAAVPVTLTLEIHQAEGRLPLGDAVSLFRHWRDLTNAERMNHWLAVLAQNAMLVAAAASGP